MPSRHTIVLILNPDDDVAYRCRALREKRSTSAEDAKIAEMTKNMLRVFCELSGKP